MSEDILYHIMTRLQCQSAASNHLNILKASDFWNIILRATGNGSISKLNSHPYIKHIKASIKELGVLFTEKVIDLQSLKQILEYSDETLLRHFDAAAEKNFFISDIIVYRGEIVQIRKYYDDFQLRLDILFKFYTEFCSVTQATDVNNYIQDVKERMQNLDKVKLKQVITSDYWKFHGKF